MKQNQSFLKRLITSNEKWITYDNVRKVQIDAKEDDAVWSDWKEITATIRQNS